MVILLGDCFNEVFHSSHQQFPKGLESSGESTPVTISVDDAGRNHPQTHHENDKIESIPNHGKFMAFFCLFPTAFPYEEMIRCTSKP